MRKVFPVELVATCSNALCGVPWPVLNLPLRFPFGARSKQTIWFTASFAPPIHSPSHYDDRPLISPHMRCEVRHRISVRFIGVTLTTSLNPHAVCVPRVLSNMPVVRTQARVPYINIQCSVTFHSSSLCVSIQTALLKEEQARIKSDQNMGHQFPFSCIALLYKASELSSLALTLTDRLY